MNLRHDAIQITSICNRYAMSAHEVAQALAAGTVPDDVQLTEGEPGLRYWLKARYVVANVVLSDGSYTEVVTSYGRELGRYMIRGEQ